MAAYAALASLMNTIRDIMNHPQVSTFFYNKHTQTLLEKSSSLLDFIEANNYGKEAEDLEREIKFEAQAAENVIYVHIMDQIHGETNVRHLLDLQQYIHNMDVVLKKANGFMGKQGAPFPVPVPVPVPGMDIEETVMVGLDAELKSLLHELTRDSKSCQKTISIVGMGGTGKTTLAKNIFENKLIKEYFHLRAWATISQRHNAKEIIAQLLPPSENSSDKSVHELGDKLHKNLIGRRYLIILDDIWSVQAWVEVRRFFPDNNNGSQIILTTRLSSVANDCGASLFMMRVLDEDNSWKLFCKTIFKTEPCPPELLEVGKKIAKLCKGLALSIIVIGGLLAKSPRTVEYWEGVVNDIKSILEESLEVVYLSYKHLPAHLKPCFLYMGVFKEDSQIRISEVIRLWVAEGFIKPKDSVMLEEIGEGYIKDLIDRNLLIAGRLSRNGKIRLCSIHDLLRDMCIKLSEQQRFFSMTSNDEDSDITTHRFVDVTSDRIPPARSILALSSYRAPVKQGLLRVLKTQGSSLNELFGNVNLRHLACRYSTSNYYGPHLGTMPRSLSTVWNLQTLFLYPSSHYLPIVAPTEIWKMRQLRHVKCGKIYLPPCDGQEDELENLRTLKTTVNLSLCREVCKIIPNVIKLSLYYDNFDINDDEDVECRCRSLLYDDCLVDHICNLDRLRKLESLNLTIYGIAKLGEKLTFPSSLKKLSLTCYDLGWNGMRRIGSLPQLEVLILNRFSDRQWNPIDGQFLRLKFLEIDYCSLEYWDADSSHFPVLEKLLLCKLPDLKEIPLGIGDIPTLELICVKYCKLSAAISALKIKENQLDNGNNSLHIQVNLHTSEPEKFKEMVESEGLSISNIQLE